MQAEAIQPDSVSLSRNKDTAGVGYLVVEMRTQRREEARQKVKGAINEINRTVPMTDKKRS
jgi:hypothetical protein